MLGIRWGFPGIRHIRVRGSCFLITTVSQNKSAIVRRRYSRLTQALCGSALEKVVNRRGDNDTLACAVNSKSANLNMVLVLDSLDNSS